MLTFKPTGMASRASRVCVIAAIFGLPALVGCNKPPNRVPRQFSAPSIPTHPKANQFVGVWETEGEVAIVITNDAGKRTISSPENETWENVVNNVRFDGEELHYDQYFYFVGPDDFSMPGSLSGYHPFSGVCNHTVLVLVDGEPDKLQTWIVSDDPDISEKYFLERAP